MKYIVGAIAAIALLAVALLIWKGNPFMRDSNVSNHVVEMVRNDKDFILVDVRTPEEYLERRIPGSILLPDYEVRDKAEDVIPDKDAKIVVYCRTGRRSAAAAKVLKDLGYENIFDLGGINSWPYETVSGE